MDALSENSLRDYKRLREQSVLIEEPELAVIRISGEDWKSWLQGQITQDIQLLGVEHPISFCVCSPTGQLIALGDLHLLDDGGWIIMPTVYKLAFLNRVEDMVILEEVEAEDLSETLRVLHHAGPTANPASVSTPYQHALTSCRFSSEPAWDIIVARELPQVFPFDETALNVARIEFGVPVPGHEILAKTLPPELGAAFESRYIHYQKGCYTGQEILQRIHSRGHTNKTLVGLLSQTPMRVGQSVFSSEPPDENGEQGAIGTVSSVALHPSGAWIALATLRNQGFRIGEEVRIENEPAKTVHLPFDFV